MLAKLAILLEYHTWVRDGGLKRKMFGMSGGGHEGHLLGVAKYVVNPNQETRHIPSEISFIKTVTVTRSRRRLNRSRPDAGGPGVVDGPTASRKFELTTC